MTVTRVVALLVAALLAGSSAAAVPAGAGAAPAKAKSAKAKKAKKKKRRKKAKRKPAAARPGAQGPQGPAGPPGPPGTSIVNRVRLAQPTVVPSGEPAKLPLTGAAWTQQADETDDFVGEVTVTLPASCSAEAEGVGPTEDPVYWLEQQLFGAPSENFGDAFFEIRLGEETIGTAWVEAWEESFGKTVTESFRIDRKLMEPGSPTARELSVTGSAYCGGGEFRLDALKINVIGIR